MVPTKEIRPAERVHVIQHLNDVLFVPNWWLHKTSKSPMETSRSFNVHCISGTSAFGKLVFLLQSTLGSAGFYQVVG